MPGKWTEFVAMFRSIGALANSAIKRVWETADARDLDAYNLDKVQESSSDRTLPAAGA
eukprot:SAG11_NODE_3066_length_2715_cov_1.813838_3_plen_58_part_00